MGVATPGFIRGSRQRLYLIESLLPPPALLRAAHSQSRASPQGGGNRAHLTVHALHLPPWHGVNLHKPPDGLRRSCGACARPPSPALALGRSQLAKPNLWLCLMTASDHCSPRLRRFVVCGGSSAHRPAAPSSPPPVPSGSRSLTRHPPAERNGSQESRSIRGALLPMAP